MFRKDPTQGLCRSFTVVDLFRKAQQFAATSRIIDPEYLVQLSRGTILESPIRGQKERKTSLLTAAGEPGSQSIGGQEELAKDVKRAQSPY